MTGLLFVLEVAAVVLIALWLWGVERSGEGWRVRLFDMRFEAAAEMGPSVRSAPRWRRLKPGAETPPAGERPPGGFRKAPATASSERPKWRRSV